MTALAKEDWFGSSRRSGRSTLRRRRRRPPQ